MSLRAEGHHLGTRALARHVGELPVEVDVGQLEPAQLRHPHAGVEQQPQDDLVAAREEGDVVE